MRTIALAFACLEVVLIATSASAQVIVIDDPHHVRRPAPRIVPVPAFTRYKIRSVDVRARVSDQVAKVAISQLFENTGSSTLEAQFLFPMPRDAAVSDLTLLVDGKELSGQLLAKDEARRIYESIVRRRRDPALLEYIGQGIFQTSVFPVPPGAKRTVEIRYTQLLKKDSGLVDLLLPIGTAKHAGQPIETVDVEVRIETSEPIKTIYSPTHDVRTERPDDTHAVCKLSLEDVTTANDVRLLYGTDDALVGMSVLSYRPKNDSDGYFLLLASPELKAATSDETQKTIVFVLDRSGSMSGQKIEQAREALKFFISHLKPGDTFNIIAYDSEVESFRPELQRVSEETISAAMGFAEGISSGGSTNIDAALRTALGMLTDPDQPNYVLFLTDGLPTVGEQNEMKIAANARDANRAGARLFSFGVGYDVNSRLLDRLSRDHRGRSVYVRPNEDIEAHVAGLYTKISSPLLTDLSLEFEFDEPRPAASGAAVLQTYPRQLTDLFYGDQLIVVGRYRQFGSVKVSLHGMLGDEHRTVATSARFVEKSADETNGFIEKLWALRRVGEIIDELDLNGHNAELVDELVQLSIRHGIMTPYTSFLADEDVELADAENLRRAGGMAESALKEFSGVGGFVQRQLKGHFQHAAQAPAAGDVQLVQEADGRVREVRTVRTVGQKTFFRKQDRWQDSSVTEEQEQRAVRIVQFSREYFDLAASHGGTLAKYLAFEEPVILNLDGRTYQIDPPPDKAREEG